MRADGGQELLEELAAAGVKVWADADGLGYEGPEEAITPEILQRLADHKPQIMVLLSEKVAGNVVKLHTPPPDAYDEHLVAAGWQARQRCSKTIWAHSETGFYYSYEMALQMAGAGG